MDVQKSFLVFWDKLDYNRVLDTSKIHLIEDNEKGVIDKCRTVLQDMNLNLL